MQPQHSMHLVARNVQHEMRCRQHQKQAATNKIYLTDASIRPAALHRTSSSELCATLLGPV